MRYQLYFKFHSLDNQIAFVYYVKGFFCYCNAHFTNKCQAIYIHDCLEYENDKIPI